MELHCQIQNGDFKGIIVDLEQVQLNNFHKIVVKLSFEEYVSTELFILCYIFRGK